MWQLVNKCDTCGNASLNVTLGTTVALNVTHVATMALNVTHVATCH